MKQLLSGLSSRVGLNLPYFVSQGAWVGGRYAIVTIVGLAISVAFSHLISKEVLGQYQFILSIVALLSIFALPGLNLAALRATTAGDTGAAAQAARISFRTSLVAILGLAAVGAGYLVRHQPDIGWSFLVAASLFPCIYVFNHWYVIYESQLDFRSSTIRIVLQNLVVLAGVVGALILKFNLIGIIAVSYSLNALFTVWFFIEAVRRLPKKATTSQLSLKYAIQCTIQKFSGSAAENVQGIVISYWLGFASLAIFQIAFTVMNAFSGLMSTLASTYFPLLLQYRKLNYQAILIQHLLLGIGFWLVFQLFLRFCFTPIYGKAFIESAAIAQSIGYLIIGMPLKVFLINFFTARDQNSFITTANSIATIVAITSFIALRSAPPFTAPIVYVYVAQGIVFGVLLIRYLLDTRIRTQPLAS